MSATIKRMAVNYLRGLVLFCAMLVTLTVIDYVKGVVA